ncbi:MAG: hypothetical protein HAW61_03935 [Candidatus Portiera sp.]|nr:hypothetical protein [Portiera sp.]
MVLSTYYHSNGTIDERHLYNGYGQLLEVRHYRWDGTLHYLDRFSIIKSQSSPSKKYVSEYYDLKGREIIRTEKHQSE